MKDFEIFFKNNSAIMILFDAENGNIADANTAALKFYGYTYNKMLSLNISDINILPKKDIKKQISGITSKKIITAFYKHKIADNTIKDIQAFASMVIMDGRKYIFGIVHDVTQLKIIEEESSRFKKIADNAIPFIGIANMQREVFYFNKSMRNAFAIPKNADLSKYKVFDFYTAKGKKIIKSVFKEILGKGFWKGENEMQSLNGQIYQVHQTIVLIKDEYGQPQYTSSTAIDITQQKKAEQKITDTAIRYKTLLENSGEGIHVVDSNLKLVEANNAFCKMLGYTENELLQMSIPDWDMQWTRKELKKRLKELMNKSAIFETQHRRKDGTIIDVEINATGILIEGREYLYASSRDISERKLTEKRLRLSESKFRALLDNSFDAIGVHIKGIWELCNPAALKLFGYSGTEELIGQPILNVIAPAEHGRIKAFVRKRSEGKSAPNTYITRGLKKNGEEFDLEVALSDFFQDNQLLVIVTLRDISARLKQEAEIKKSLDQLKKIASNIPGVVYQFRLRPDGTTCFPYASDAIKKIYNVDPQDVMEDASVVFSRLHPDDINHVAASIKKSAEDLSVWRDEYRVILDGKTERWLLGNAMPQPENDGSVLWHGFITDITDHKKLEKDLIKANKKIEMAMDQWHLTYWEMNHAKGAFTFNDQFYKLYDTNAQKEGGYHMAAAVYAKEFLFEEDAHLVRDAIIRFVSEKLSHMQLEHRIRTRAGKVKYIDVRISALYNSNGDLTGTYGCNQDVTEFKLAEIALRKSQKKHSDLLKLMDTVFENVPGLLFIKDCNNNFIKVNKYLAKGYGKEMEEVNGKSLTAFHSPKEAAKFYKDDLDVLNSGIAKLNIEESWPTTEGMKWLTTSKIPYTNSNGETIGVIGMSMDITARKHLELALKNSEDKLKQAELLGKFGYWELNLETQLFDFSTGFAKIYGLESDQVSWNELKKMRLPQYNKVMENSMKALIEDDKPFDVEYEIKRQKDNEIVGIHVISKYNNAKGIVFGSIQDITEKKKKEKEILRLNNELKELANHLQRLRADERNKLALEVHDKIGQRLVGIKFEIDFIKKHIKEYNPEFDNKIRVISDEIAEMLKDFNAIYTEVNPTFIDDLSLFDAIDSLAIEYRKKNNLKIKFTSNIENEKFSHETKWNIYKILEECLHNICTHSKAENVKIKLLKTEGQLQLEVEDDGTGFDISKLNMSKQIGIIEMRERVNAAGGVLVFDSVPGRGTHIKIILSNL